jgi:hypothetical protein
MISLCYKDICLGHHQEVKSLQSSKCQHNDFAKIHQNCRINFEVVLRCLADIMISKKFKAGDRQDVY